MIALIFLILCAGTVLAVFLAFLVFFAVASLTDTLTANPGSSSARRARRAAGMYVRRVEAPEPVGVAGGSAAV